MSTSHRGLPPPAAMNLPPPSQQQQQQQNPQMGQQLPLSQPMGQLPAPPPQWQGAEDSMRNWLHAKAEEDKRKQEEEKTRQESFRLEQRKIEQEMLRTSLAGEIPPYMVPMVFAGMGGGNLSNASVEWARHYLNQAFQQQQQVTQFGGQPSPELRRDSRTAPNPYAPSHPPASSGPPLMSTAVGPPSAPGLPSATFIVPGYQVSPASRSRQPAASVPLSRLSQGSHLPRLNTEEMSSQQGLQPLPGMQVIPGQPPHPLQQTQTVQQQQQQQQQPQEQPQPSPSIYFHHWQPPAPQAPSSSTTQPISPGTVTSPRKRKNTGTQQTIPPPPSQYTSPPHSQGGGGTSMTNAPSSRRRGHSRQRSDASAGRGLEGYGRAGSRNRQTESMQSGGGSASASSQQQATYSSVPPEGPSMQSGGPSSYSPPQPRPAQERYNVRPPSNEPRRYSAGSTEPRPEEQRRETPTEREETKRPSNTPGSTQPPR